MSKVIFKQKYSDESLYDLERDVSEAISPEYNPLIADVEADEHGFRPGTFTVTIEYNGDEE